MNVAVPLISAALAGLVAWIVSVRQGRTARENWVLDKRYVLYEQLLDAGLRLLGGGGFTVVRQRLSNPEEFEVFLRAAIAMDLVAPETVRKHSQHVRGMAAAAIGSSSDRLIEELITGFRDMADELRTDLVPKHMR